MDQKRRKKLIKKLQSIVGREWVLHASPHLQVYGYDASLGHSLPDFIVLPENAREVAATVQLALKEKIPYLPRGAGTNLTGGSIPCQGGIVIEVSRMKALRSIDLKNLRAEVEVGATNLEVQNALAPSGYLYAPDPASQKVSTIGGNVGENSGGPHCLKYGVTTNHVLGLEMVMPDGKIIPLGGKCLDPPGYDLVGLMVGSEGTLGMAIQATLRLLHQPQAVQTILAIFDGIEDASKTVSAIIAAGIIPAALEMIDKVVLQAVEASVHAGYPLDAEGVLIIELDGIREGMERQAGRIRQICQDNHVREVRLAKTAGEREVLWKGRRGAFGAVARVKTSYLCADGTVPRTKLPQILRQVGEIGQKHNLTIGNVFHAGDGNLHPLILFDDRDENERARVIQAGKEILEACALAGGTISGEHGIGLEKIESMNLIFSPEDISFMRKVKEALDPTGLCNPGKIFPTAEASSQTIPAQQELSPGGDFLAGLIKIVGQENCYGAASEAEKYSVDGKVPKAVAFPGSVQETSEILRLAAAKNSSLIPMGRGTKMAYGNPPYRVDSVLNLSRMNRVLELDLENLTITLEAGVKLQDIQATLAQHRCFIPLDAPLAEATIGGILSTNSSGPKRLLYGSARDITLGAKIVLAGGEIVKSGGKTVKNVSGYDMTKLYIGSLGTLGIIVEATLRLLPAPEQEALLLLPCREVSQAVAVASQIIHSDLLPSSLILCNKKSATILSRTVAPALPQGFLLLIGVEGTREAVEAQIQIIQNMKEEGVSGFQVFKDSLAGEVWKTITEIHGKGTAVSCKASTSLSRGGELFKKAEALSSDNALETAILAHLGTGTVNLFFGADEEAGLWQAGKIPEIIAYLRKEAEEGGGSLVIEAAPLTLKENISVWGQPGPSFPYMKAIKNALDPLNLLNPGRFYGGL
ncbi:MAG: FAD-linked oxidase C-terminal domain-containing protein [Thermodesulfobacteriota bacterium]|nr:FAD-linked oxidase C-terminal domain-containing protein [Thermodesulfobacteriota bacterium]